MGSRSYYTRAPNIVDCALQMNLSINQDADTTLRRFQEWQRAMNPGDDSHPNHHDCALLISKYASHSQFYRRFNLISRLPLLLPF